MDKRHSIRKFFKRLTIEDFNDLYDVSRDYKKFKLKTLYHFYKCFIEKNDYKGFCIYKEFSRRTRPYLIEYNDKQNDLGKKTRCYSLKKVAEADYDIIDENGVLEEEEEEDDEKITEMIDIIHKRITVKQHQMYQLRIEIDELFRLMDEL